MFHSFCSLKHGCVYFKLIMHMQNEISFLENSNGVGGGDGRRMQAAIHCVSGRLGRGTWVSRGGATNLIISRPAAARTIKMAARTVELAARTSVRQL